MTKQSEIMLKQWMAIRFWKEDLFGKSEKKPPPGTMIEGKMVYDMLKEMEDIFQVTIKDRQASGVLPVVLN